MRATRNGRVRPTGYAGTTLVAVAGTAGVSVDTVCKGFGSTIGLLKADLEVMVGGDDTGVALLERGGFSGAA